MDCLNTRGNDAWGSLGCIGGCRGVAIPKVRSQSSRQGREDHALYPASGAQLSKPAICGAKGFWLNGMSEGSPGQRSGLCDQGPGSCPLATGPKSASMAQVGLLVSPNVGRSPALSQAARCLAQHPALGVQQTPGRPCPFV